MERKVVQIDEFKARRTQRKPLAACYCDAVRAADELMTWERAELRRRERKPEMLRLESLEAGVPVVAGGWDLVCSATVLAGLPAVAARQVVKAIVARLSPGGRVLLSSVAADALLGECPYCRGAGRVRRIEADMVELAAAVSLNAVGGQLVYRDFAGLNVYLELHKSASGAEVRHPLQMVRCLERVVSAAV